MSPSVEERPQHLFVGSIMHEPHARSSTHAKMASRITTGFILITLYGYLSLLIVMIKRYRVPELLYRSQLNIHFMYLIHEYYEQLILPYTICLPRAFDLEWCWAWKMTYMGSPLMRKVVPSTNSGFMPFLIVEHTLAHACCAYIDHKNKAIFFFDPEGEIGKLYTFQHNILSTISYFISMDVRKYKFNSLEHFFVPQKNEILGYDEARGTCVAWTLLWMTEWLKHIHPEELKYANKKIKELSIYCRKKFRYSESAISYMVNAYEEISYKYLEYLNIDPYSDNMFAIDEDISKRTANFVICALADTFRKLVFHRCQGLSGEELNYQLKIFDTDFAKIKTIYQPSKRPRNLSPKSTFTRLTNKIPYADALLLSGMAISSPSKDIRERLRDEKKRAELLAKITASRVGSFVRRA